MNCKNCGNPLAPGMQFCISCGKAVEEVSSVTASTPITAPAAEPEVIPEVAPAEVLNTTPSQEVTPPQELNVTEQGPAPMEPIQPMPTPATPTPEPVAPITNTISPMPSPTTNPPQPKNKAVLIAIIVVVVLIIGGIAIFFGYKYLNNKNAEKPTKPDPVTPVVVNDTNVQTYNGYDFTIAKGYYSDINTEGDLRIYDDTQKWVCFSSIKTVSFATVSANILTFVSNMSQNGATNVAYEDVTYGGVKVIKINYTENEYNRIAIIRAFDETQSIVTDFADLGGLSDDIITDVVTMLSSPNTNKAIFNNNAIGIGIIESIIK